MSSIGAIRAHEMRHEGMRGFGWVHAQFAAHPDFADDEMALLHLPLPPYTPVTEALVNLRYALQRRGAALGIGAGRQRALVDLLRECWFGDRSAELMLDLEIPLQDLQATEVRGSISLAGNDVRLTPGTPLLADPRGRIDFTQRGLTIVGGRVAYRQRAFRMGAVA